MMVKILVFHGRVIIPLLLGVCIGIAISFIALPLLEERTCGTEVPSTFTNKLKGDNAYNTEFSEGIDWSGFTGPEYNPRVIKPERSDSQNSEKPQRHRFIAEEINIMKTFFVAVLTTPDQVLRRAKASNQTYNSLLHEVDAMFYVADKKSSKQYDLPMKSFNLKEQTLLPIEALRHLNSQYQRKYRYFALVYDSVLVNAHHIMQMLQSGYGQPLACDIDSDGLCDLSSGVLLSQDTLKAINATADPCDFTFREFGPDNQNLALTKCLEEAGVASLHSDKKGIEWFNYRYQSYKSGSRWTQPIERAAFVYNLETEQDIASIQRTWIKWELRQIKEQLQQYYGTENQSEPWPNAVRPPYHTTNRYDVIRWTLLKDNTSYLEWDFINSEPLKAEDRIRFNMNRHLSRPHMSMSRTAFFDSHMAAKLSEQRDGADLEDHDEMVNEILRYLNSDDTPRFKLKRIVHAYRRMDPTRGLEYLFTLEVEDTILDEVSRRIFELVKPMSGFEMMDIPLKNTDIAVHILVPIIHHDLERIEELISMFRINITVDEHAYLHLLLPYRPLDSIESNNDRYFSTKKLVTSNKNMTGGRIDWVNIVGSNLSTSEILFKASKRFSKDSIIFTSTLTTQFTNTFITRVRENTEKGEWIFAPIAFWQFRPSLITSPTYPHKIDISRSDGHFGEEWYDHLSFYAGELRAFNPRRHLKIIDYFFKDLSTQIFRSTDPDLIVKHDSNECLQGTPDTELCQSKYSANIASAPVLAKTMLQNGLLNAN